MPQPVGRLTIIVPSLWAMSRGALFAHETKARPAEHPARRACVGKSALWRRGWAAVGRHYRVGGPVTARMADL